MTPFAKSMIGLGAALAVGAIAHWPAGLGDGMISRLEAEGQALVAGLGVPGVTMTMQRSPLLARTAILTGPANRFQREGMGSMPGIDRRLLAIPGMRRVEWTNPPAS